MLRHIPSRSVPSPSSWSCPATAQGMASCVPKKHAGKATDKGSLVPRCPLKKTQENYATNMEKLWNNMSSRHVHGTNYGTCCSCMLYLFLYIYIYTPTFTPNMAPNVGKQVIHGIYAVVYITRTLALGYGSTTKCGYPISGPKHRDYRGLPAKFLISDWREEIRKLWWAIFPKLRAHCHLQWMISCPWTWSSFRMQTWEKQVKTHHQYLGPVQCHAIYQMRQIAWQVGLWCLLLQLLWDQVLSCYCFSFNNSQCCPICGVSP